jgi:hypothetical protein
MLPPPDCGERERIGRLQGKTTRPGLRKCYACRKPFTVRIGSIFEDSHLPLASVTCPHQDMRIPCNYG